MVIQDNLLKDGWRFAKILGKIVWDSIMSMRLFGTHTIPISKIQIPATYSKIVASGKWLFLDNLLPSGNL